MSEEIAMPDGNRQILLVETPKGKLGSEHFRLIESPLPTPQEGEVLARVRYISLDAANRAWMQGATYRSAVEAGSVMAGGALAEIVPGPSPWRCRLRGHRLAGLRGAAGQARGEAAAIGAADASP
jgi:NADPH-dependent curcumin reductase CurA